ncbi:MAG: hypothetical protein VYC14_08700 [Actinomycetota bacterium]|nr:hypothetical protein [Actinomycetota bacterium]
MNDKLYHWFAFLALGLVLAFVGKGKYRLISNEIMQLDEFVHE